MHAGQFVFSQVIDYLPMHIFRRCLARYGGNRYMKKFSCFDQYPCMSFAQLTHRESLRDIEVCLRAQADKLYHMGIRGRVSRSTLSDANESRDWRIHADLAQALIRTVRPLYADEDLAVGLDRAVYALDASTIDLCLSLFPWALFRSAKSAVKLHALLDLRGSIPAFIHVSDGKLHDVNVLDVLQPEPGAFYIMDRAYPAFERLFTLHAAGSFFIIRAKSNTRCRRLYSRPAEKSDGVRCDQVVTLTGAASRRNYPQLLRRIKFRDPRTGNTLNFLTNNFALPARTVADLYRRRRQVELFFKWIKQHLRIKTFFGTSENAVKSRIWIAISVYVLVAIIRKRLNVDADLYRILQILSFTRFEKTPLFQLLAKSPRTPGDAQLPNQLNLFNNLTGQ